MLFGAAYAEANLWAEWRAGHQLRAVERNRPESRFNPVSHCETQGFCAANESYQLKRTMAV
jgi:hypothetical protein